MAQTVALKDPKAGADTAMGAGVASLTITPQSFGEVMAFADKMAASRFVPAHLRDKPADCLVVCLQALRWGFDPFAVAQKTYFIKDGSPPAYEAQLVNAVVLARAPLVGRPKITWAGNWPQRACTVSGLFQGDSEPKARTVHAVNIKTRNSPLWATDPDQQLAYYTTRAWARLYCPDVLMGVYTPDDDDMRAERATDVTPAAEVTPPASRLDAMEAAIAGEPPPAEDPMPAEGNEFGATQPELPRQPDAMNAKQMPGESYAEARNQQTPEERAEAWGNKALGFLEAAPSLAAVVSFEAKNRERLEEVKGIDMNVYATVAKAIKDRKAALNAAMAG